MSRFLPTALAAFSLALPAASPARSDNTPDPRNRVSFQVEAVREIANDWATARLSVIAESLKPAEVADSVNRQMGAALATAKKAKGVEVRSGAYVTQPIYDNGRIVRWRAQQELQLESADVDRLSRLIGTLQSESVALSGIHFSVQESTRRALEDELIQEALAAFRQRAALIAKGLDAANWSLIHLSLGNAGAPPPRFYARAEAMMMDKAAPPAFEAGSSEVRVQIDGTVELD